MTIDEIRRFHRARPFVPFRIHLEGKRSIDVAHPEVMAISRGGRTFAVAWRGAFEIIDLLRVLSLEPLKGRGKRGNRRR